MVLERRSGARLYGWQEEVESNTVEVHVHKLRTRLDGPRSRPCAGWLPHEARRS